LSPKRYDVIALGETMLSLVAEDGTLETGTRFVATHGGAESNTCVGLARAGLRVAWVSRLGDDPGGRRIRSALADAGVDVTWVTLDGERATGVMLRDTHGAVRYLRGGSAASAVDAADLEGVPIETARAVFVSGITAMLGPGPQRAAKALLDGSTGLRVVDPNLRDGLWGSARPRELIEPLLERCDLLLGGEAELASFAGGAGASLARACAQLGPTEVVVKRGAAGAGALDEAGAWHEQPGVPVRELDPVGAGDAFNAAYLAARLEGRDVPEALKDAAVAGANVAATFGDTERGER
jgi:2-dehydro-3-deoxygluconokinase